MYSMPNIWSPIVGPDGFIDAYGVPTVVQSVLIAVVGDMPVIAAWDYS